MSARNKLLFFFVISIVLIILGWFMFKDFLNLSSSSSSSIHSSSSSLSPSAEKQSPASSSNPANTNNNNDEPSLPPQRRTRPPNRNQLPPSAAAGSSIASSRGLLDLFKKSRQEKYSSGEYQRQHLHRNKKLNLKSEDDKMVSGLRQVTEPLKCKKSSSLETSPYLLEKYGPVEENWCEMKSSLISDWEDDIHNYTTIFDSGTTYFDYPSSSDGVDWPYSTCPIKHKIVCRRRSGGKTSSSTRNIGSKKKSSKGSRTTSSSSKALVIYIVSSGTNPYQLHQESINLDFFIKHGYVPANTPTALFDSVDFVFAKIQLAGEESQSHFRECGNLSAALGDDEGKTYSNVKFMMIPRVPCDLCAHSYIMNKLGLFDMSKEQEKVKHHEFPYPAEESNRSLDAVLTHLFTKRSHKKETHRKFVKKSEEDSEDDQNENNQEQQMRPEYSQIFMMNSGVRGPFFSSADDDEDGNDNNNKRDPQTTWLDFTAMGGRRKIPNPRSGFFDDDFIPKNADDKELDCPIHVSVSSSISFQRSLHHQSFFLSFPLRIMKERIFTLFANVCPSPSQRGPPRSKRYCVVKGEVAIGKAVLGTYAASSASSSSSSLSSAMYSLSKQYYVQNLKHDAERKRQIYYHPEDNPACFWLDACKSLFLKDGGSTFMARELPKNSLHAIDRLTKGANHRRRRKKGGKKEDNDDDVLWDVDSIQRMFAYYGCDWKF